MDENSYNDEFDALTEGLKYEKVYDDLAERAQFVRVLAMHCGEIYKTARKAGLPRRTAAGMAREYFSFETAPAGIYLTGGEK